MSRYRNIVKSCNAGFKNASVAIMQTVQVKPSAMGAKEPAIERAIVALGGKVKAAEKIGVSFTTIHAWQRQGYIKDIHWAQRASELKSPTRTGPCFCIIS